MRTRLGTWVLLGLLVAWVAPTPPAGANTEPETGGKSDKMVLVLDSSGSMKEQASGGQRKIAVAKQALRQVISGLPSSAEVGLRVYGAKVFSRNDPGACRDSQLVVPIGTGNRAQMRQQIKTYKPYGETPIGYALQQAAKDLGTTGQRTIVLVSDGEATCPPDPCEVARNLSKKGINLKIDVVGLDVSGAARRQLQCVAAKGNGTYYDADSAEELTASLDRLSTRAFRPFAISGLPVTGTPAPEGAPVLQPDAQYVDTLSEPAEPKHYLIEREIPGSTIHVGASARPEVSIGQISVELQTPDGATCSTGTAASHEFTISQGLITTGTSSFAGGAACADADSLLLTVESTSFGDDITGAPVEVVVAEEPPVEDAESLPPAADAPIAPDPWKVGKARSGVVPGSAFSNAPTIEAGHYKGALLPGEIQFYRVELDWGQQLEAQLRFPAPGAALAEALGPVHFSNLLTYAPNRSLNGTGDGRLLLQEGQATAVTVAGAAVRYNNRGSTDAISGAARAGDYYVAVSLDEDDDGESYLTPFTLSVNKVGEPAAGPTYVEAQPTESAPESTPAPDPQESASPPSEPQSDDTTQDVADEEGSGLDAGLAIVLVLVILLAGVAYVFLRRRRT